jgi:hypothetical protein
MPAIVTPPALTALLIIWFAVSVAVGLIAGRCIKFGSK